MSDCVAGGVVLGVGAGARSAGHVPGCIGGGRGLAAAGEQREGRDQGESSNGHCQVGLHGSLRGAGCRIGTRAD
jgi:hypothetical protein